MLNGTVPMARGSSLKTQTSGRFTASKSVPCEASAQTRPKAWRDMTTLAIVVALSSAQLINRAARSRRRAGAAGSVVSTRPDDAALR